MTREALIRDPMAYSAGNWGLFQIQRESHRAKFEGDCERLYEPEVNVAVAYAIWADWGGWGPWGCKP